MIECNPVRIREEFKGIKIYDKKPDVPPKTARVYLGTGGNCVAFFSTNSISRSELMSGQYTLSYLIELREFRHTYEQLLCSSEPLGGFIAKISLSVRVSKPEVFVQHMVKNMIKHTQQKVIPFLECVSMSFSTEECALLQHEFIAMLEKTPFVNTMERNYGIRPTIESILIRPDNHAVALLQEKRRQQEEFNNALKKMEEDFNRFKAKQEKEVEMRVANLKNQYELRNREQEMLTAQIINQDETDLASEGGAGHVSGH